MRRLSLWMKAHPMFGDSVVAAVLAALELLALVEMPVGVQPWVYWVTGAGLVLPMVLRRRHPVLTAYLLLLAGLVQLLTHQAPPPGSVLEHDARVRLADIALGIALYTLVAYVGRRAAAWYALWLAAGTVWWLWWRVESAYVFWFALFIGLTFAFHWVLAEFIGARRAYQLEVEQRLALLETERDQQAKIAVAAERARIARELHDVVAHAVSVMVVQADGAACTTRSRPELAERAAQTISSTGREALTELRSLLGVLRSDSGERELVPQPGAESLSELAERVREVGLPVRLELAGDLADLPAGIGFGVYRIVQEALTNSLKHAGPGASATVRVRRSAERVELEVADDGRRRSGALVGVAGGNGLIGMRERAHVFGGTLQAGPRSGGGWLVRASLPLGG